jgi:hypothetical protein
MRFSLFWNVTHNILAITDVSGQPIVIVHKGRAVQECIDEEWRYITAWPLKMGPLGCPETSVTTNLHYVTIYQNNEDPNGRHSFTKLLIICEVWADYNVGSSVITIAIPHLGA